jgi:hypothetical protein
MRFGQLILIITFMISPFVGFTQGGVSENEKKYFCSFLDSLIFPDFAFTHSEFMKIVVKAKQINGSKLQSKFSNYSCRNREGKTEIFSFENESKIFTDSIRKGNYNFTLYERNDSMIDYYYQYPPDIKSKTVDVAILEIYVNLINCSNNFFQLQKYGNDAFKTGNRMPDNYREILNDFFTSEPGLFNPKKVDRFIFYQSEKFDGQYWIELYVDKKSKKIKTFGALKYW